MAAVKTKPCFLRLIPFFVLFIARTVAVQNTTARAYFNDNHHTPLALKVSRDKVIMNCTLFQLPEPDSVAAVRWLRTAENGSSGLPSGVRFLGELNHNLLINNFSPLRDTGNYWCIITTRSGRSYTSNHLELRSISLKIYAQDPVEALRYTRVELNCAIRGPPGITYRTKWYKGHELQETVIGYKPLVIENVTQGGEYTCRVEEVTNNSNDDEESFELVIVDPPQLLPVSSVQNLNKGTPLTLTCAAMDDSTISFVWRLNGKVVDQSYVSNFGHSSNLMTNSVTFDDQGNYTCNASNLAGFAVQTYKVEVVGSPDIQSRGGTLEEVTNGNMVLDCQALANPSIHGTQWMKEGESSIPHRHLVLSNNSLMLYNVTVATSGTYNCTVTNSLGSASITYELLVLGAPNHPSNFTHSILSQDNRSVLLTWTIPEVASGQRLDGYKLELWTKQNPQHPQTFNISPNVHSKILNNLFPGETYHARLWSYNRAGASSPQTTSFLLDITAPKLDLSVTPLPGGRSLSVEWTLVYDGGPDVVQFVFEVYVVDGAKVMVYTVSPRLDAKEHLITGLQPTTKYMVCITISNSVMATTLNQVINTTAAPPSRPSSLDVSAVTTRHVQLSFSVLEGSESVSHFLLNITTNGAAEPSQTVIARDDRNQVESLMLEGGKLHVELVVLDLQPFTTYSFQVAAVSDIGTGEYSSATKPVQLEDGRIIYFTVVGVVGGVFLVVIVVMTTIVVMVWRSRASQKRKRTFSINAGANSKPENSFVLQSPPSGKKDRGGTPSSRGLSSPTCSSSQDVPSLLVMDVTHSGRHHRRTPSCEKFSSTRMRPDSLASDSVFSSSVGVFEKRPSISHSEPGISHYIKHSPASSLPQSQLHGSTGRMPASVHNPLYPRHQLLTDHMSSSGQNIYVEVSPQEQEKKSLGMAQNGYATPAARAGHSPSLSHAGYAPTQAYESHAPLQTHGSHTHLQSHGSHAPLQTHGSQVPFMHQTSVQHYNTHLLSPPHSNILSSSAPMINVRLSRESVLEPVNPLCMTDV